MITLLLVATGLLADPSVALSAPGEISSLEEHPQPPPPPAPDAETQASQTDVERVGGVEDSIVEGGHHWRIATSHGPVHVWMPAGYDERTAGVVVYVHGYWTDVDTAWVEHHLASQFSASNKNALFIVPEAQQNGDEDPPWRSLTTLIDVAVTHVGVPRPTGPVVISGHSGAFAQLAEWVDNVDDEPVDHVILYDALYACGEDFRQWLVSDGAHRLTVVANHTLPRVRRFRALMRLATRESWIPETLNDLSKRERNSRFLFLVSQYDHYAIITSGKVIPLLLGRTALTDVTPPIAAAR